MASFKESYSVRDLVELPYGVLLKRYKKVSIDKDLYDRLFNLKDYRNFLVHQAFLEGSDMPPDMKSFIGVYSAVSDYDELKVELNDCIKKLIQEYNLQYKK